jgi:hypothetical protein
VSKGKGLAKKYMFSEKELKVVPEKKKFCQEKLEFVPKEKV